MRDAVPVKAGTNAGVTCHQLARWATCNQQCGLERRSVLVAFGEPQLPTSPGRQLGVALLPAEHSMLAE